MDPTLARWLYFAAQRGRGEPVDEVLASLEPSQRWPRETLDALQWKYRRTLLEHAFATVPFYRDAAAALGISAADIRSDGDWARLPWLEKPVVQERNAELLSSRAPRGQVSSTSGSSGVPVSVLRGQRSWAHHHANIFRGWRWFGLDVGDPHAYFWGRTLDPSARRNAELRDRFFNRVRCSAFTLDGPRAREFYRLALGRRLRFAYGYPSALALFAEEIASARLDGRALGWKAVITTAEVLHDHQRSRIADVLGCSVADSYGCAETGVAGLECPSGALHVPVESVVVERVPAGDGTHEVLLTDLHNLCQPMIRYRVGDRIDPAPAGCDCGLTLPVIGRVQGRAGGMLTLPDGRRINANLPSYVFKHHGREGTVREYQFVQFPEGRIELLLVSGPAWTQAVEPRLRQEVREALGVEVEIRLVPRIERSPGGKHRDWVRSDADGTD
jgi:phenylacetate-CoA ligase